MARVLAITGHRATPLERGWELARADAPCDDPAQLPPLSWSPALVPGTAASSLRASGQWTVDEPRDFDADDWWWRCRFEHAAPAPGTRLLLRLGGLATLADVWLNGTRILRSENMFEAHALDVTAAVQGTNELLVRCRALAPVLRERRPRPRWRSPLISSQQLRWVRTTLLGRMPGGAPPVAPVGPWRAIALEEERGLSVERCEARASLEGDDGVVRVHVRVRALDAAPTDGTLIVRAPDRTELTFPLAAAEGGFGGEARVPRAERWWPHTHGPQPLYALRIVLGTAGGAIELDLGRTGFRTVSLDTPAGDFAVRWNGARIFCRGAVWSPPDIVALDAPAEVLRERLGRVRDAGMNMLRVGGTMTYESDAFHAICDELGILVWQDFMFASLDYPEGDPAFCAAAGREASAVVSGLQLSPGLALFCGNSEVAMQAAMMGRPPAERSGPLFDGLIPAACAAARPDVPYLPSTPWGGALPLHVGEGTSSYYGVGAYLRPLEDARRSGVRFAAECLAFANLPEPSFLAGARLAPALVHRWKERVPHHPSAPWDFEDVRDHYLSRLFRVDVPALRRDDFDRYLALSGVVSGEAMAASFAEWRREGSSCSGALVWLLQDRWPGSGWGVLDSSGGPKPAWWYLRRALQPVAILLTDEGLDGLRVHAVNDSPLPLAATVRLSYFLGTRLVESGEERVELPARGVLSRAGAALIGGRFFDGTHAYRFGPAPADVSVATLEIGGQTISRAFHFPGGLPSARHEDVGLTATAEADGAGWIVSVRAERFAQSVQVDAPGWLPDDSYFHLPPGGAHRLRLVPRGAPAPSLEATLRPLNAIAATRARP